MQLSCEGSSDRERDRDRDTDRDRGFGCIASSVPSPLCCKPLSKLLSHVLMSEWSDVTSRRQRRYERKSQGWRAQSGLRAPEWQCAACKTQSFLSGDTCRGCSKQRDTQHDEYINEWSQTVAWPQQIGSPSGEAAYAVSKPKGAAQVFSLARQQLAQARASGLGSWHRFWELVSVSADWVVPTRVL